MAPRYKAANQPAVPSVVLDMNSIRARAAATLLLAPLMVVAATTLMVTWASPVTASVPAAAPPRCHGHVATIVGTNKSEYIAGTPGRDAIVALAGIDRIRSGEGDDIVCAGKGEDELWGGLGNDRLYGEGDAVFRDPNGPRVYGDTLHGGPGDDLLDAGYYFSGNTTQHPNSISYLEAKRKVVVKLGGDTWVAVGEGRDRIVPTRRLTLVGSGFSDRLDASRLQGDVAVIGNAGSDRIWTGAGDDYVHTEGEGEGEVFGGSDQVWSGGGSDLVRAYSGPDALWLGDGPDVAFTKSRVPVTVHGGNGGDLISARVTEEDGLVLDGGTGHNKVTLHGGDAGPLTLDRRRGTLETETFDAVVRRFTTYNLLGGTAWTYRGWNLPDHVFARHAGPVRLFTFGGDDELWGSDHDDLLDGGDGTDVAHPGLGHDTCVSIEVGSCE
jgi:Ca2+-binding RTX toxin-like protein